MKKNSKDQGYFIAANEGGVQHTRSGDAWMEYTNESCHGDQHGHGALPAEASGWEIKERR